MIEMRLVHRFQWRHSQFKRGNRVQTNSASVQNLAAVALMLNKNILLENLRGTLIHILCKDLEEDEVQDMQNSIDDFMRHSAKHFSEQELLIEFDSAEKILDQFIAHLETRKEMAGHTLH
jgi:hypothetical protein